MSSAFNQLLLRCGTRGTHGGENAAAVGGDVGIAYAIETLFEFVTAIATEHQVSVAINKAGRDDTAVDVGGGIGVVGR